VDGGTRYIARSLARRRAVRVGGAVLLALGIAAGSLPLLEAPGYELGEAAALLAAVLAPLVGVPAARLELARPAPSPLSAWAGSSLVVAGLTALFLAGALVRAALGPCAVIGPAAAFLPLLALPSALLGAALAVAVAFVARGRRAAAGALYALAALVALAVSLYAAYRGPAAFVFDPLLGAWPGPIYDEALVPDLRAVLFRGAAAAEAIAVAAVAEAFARAGRAGLPPRGPQTTRRLRRRDQISPPRGPQTTRRLRRRDQISRSAAGPLLAVLVAAGTVVSARAALEAFRLSGSRSAVSRALGGRSEGPRCTLVFPVEKSAASVEALLRDCEFHLADVARALDVRPPARVTVYVYRSAEEKRRLVGASGTEYAKPWLRELHLVDAPLPHPLLRHELVHVVGAEIARGPLGVPARALVLVSAGLVEGLAAALETPRGRFTVHEWSRAARDLGFSPDVARIVGPAGFYAEPPARAYTAAGSFLAFLLDRYGAEKVRAAYRTGEVARAMGVPLPALAEEWARFLAGVEAPPGLATVARAQLGRRSIFGRPCAREVATLEARAAAAAAAGRAAEACALYERVADRAGAASLKAAGDVRARAGDLDRAAEAYRAARAAAEDDGALRAAIAAAEGDLAWRRGDVAAAVSAWSAALGTHPERAETRRLEAKIVAVTDPRLAAAARPFLLGDGDASLALARVARVPHPLAAYLVGRALATRGGAAAAIPELERAAAGGLSTALAREALLLLGDARCAAGARAAGEAALRALAGAGASAADRARVDESLRRCAFGDG
jgi:hypothetical protein